MQHFITYHQFQFSPIILFPAPSTTAAASLSKSGASAEDSLNSPSKRKAAAGPVRPPKKPRDHALYALYIIKDLPCGGVSVACRYCQLYNKKNLQKFNPSKARSHSINQCDGIDDAMRKRLQRGTQSAKRNGDLYAVMSASSTVAEMREDALSRPLSFVGGSASPASTMTTASTSTRISVGSHKATSAPFIDLTGDTQPRRKLQHTLTSRHMLGPSMTKAQADKIIMAHLKAAIVRGEPPERILDDYVRAAIIESNPAIRTFLPLHKETIYNNYVVEIDREARAELATFIANLHGLINIGMDGATVNRKQKVNSSFAVSFVQTHHLNLLHVYLPLHVTDSLYSF